MGIPFFAQLSCFLKYNYYRKNSQPLISKKISQLLSLLKIIFRIKHISPRTFQLLIRVQCFPLPLSASPILIKTCYCIQLSRILTVTNFSPPATCKPVTEEMYLLLILNISKLTNKCTISCGFVELEEHKPCSALPVM